MVGWDPGESKLSKVHCDAQFKTGKERKKKSLQKLAINLYKLTRFIAVNNEISQEPQASVQLIT